MNINFIDGPFFELIEKTDQEKTYQVEFINKDNNRTEAIEIIKSNWWARASIKYFANWKIRVTGVDNSYFYEYDFDCAGKRVLIGLETTALGDRLAWLEYVEQFRVKHNCTVICSTYQNDFFRPLYPEMEFVEPGTVVENLYALYRVGIFFMGDTYDQHAHPADPFKQPLQKIASDILGLPFKEARPRLPLNPKVKKKKQVCIGIHTTTQGKYWNNPTGWQDVVDYLNEEGYQVIVTSKEEDAPAGMEPLTGIIQHPPGDLSNVLQVLQESEFFIGLSSGLSWLAWAAGLPTIIISGVTDTYVEPLDNVYRIINKKVCNNCWEKYYFDRDEWYFCPVHKGTDKAFECTKAIKAIDVIQKIKLLREQHADALRTRAC